MNRVEMARRASGMTQQAAMAILGVSYPTYIKKEQNPKLMKFGELRALGDEMDDISRRLLWESVAEVGASMDDDRPLDDITLGEYFGLGGNARIRGELEKTLEIFLES